MDFIVFWAHTLLSQNDFFSNKVSLTFCAYIKSFHSHETPYMIIGQYE
ncbi:hypothetical protein CZ794_12710 [Psychrobacter sp. JB385]|nr:hypothetical protein CZ794_12710 [Psychrobacter sp. JB385]